MENPAKPKFRGLDTETHLGKAVLMATPVRWIMPTSFEDCLEFLFAEKEYVAYNADYDVCAMLSYCGPPVLERLYQLSKWTIDVELPDKTGFVRPVKVALRYVPRKFFTASIVSGKKANRRKFTIYDMVQFYNMRLEKAAPKFLGEEKKDPGVAWSELYAVLKAGGERARKIVDYCCQDARLVERLAEQTTEKFAKIGVVFERPISCASLSYRVFKNDMKFDLPHSYNHSARESFRGGMIECLQTGYFKQAWYIDVRSAYPAAIRDLKTMPKNFLKIHNGELHPSVLENGYASINCRIRLPRDWKKGWVPYFGAGDAMILYPVGEWDTWIDLTSYKRLSALGFVKKVYGGIQAWGTSDEQPFAKQVEYLFKQRAKGEDLKWSVKIILNSLYGKFAETRKYRTSDMSFEELLDLGNINLSFRGHERFLPHTNFFMAGEITSRTRWKLIEDLNPEDVIFYATDGVFLTKKPSDLDFGAALGQWSEAEEVRDLVVVGSGVYAYKEANGKTVTKFRGFDSSLNLYELLDRRRHAVPIDIQRNQKLGASVMTGRWDRFNVIHVEERELNVNFDRKRIWEKKWTAKELLTRSFKSKPWQIF